MGLAPIFCIATLMQHRKIKNEQRELKTRTKTEDQDIQRWGMDIGHGASGGHLS